MISGTPFWIADIDVNWEWIGPLVEGVDPGDNAGDDLRASCREGRALCLISDDGLLVVELQPSRYGNGELDLFVRMAVSKGERGSIQRSDAHLDAIANELGATRLVFHTRRPGMHKVLNPEWSVSYTAFERAVHGNEVRSGTGDACAASPG
jgi:hypothetical protein